jgi:hypothetical protein
VTLQLWTETNLRAWLTLFTEDFPAKTLAMQERVRDWRESEADFFTKSFEFAKKHPLNSFSLKTWRELDSEDQLRFRKHWPASAMIVDLECYPLPRLAQIIGETAISASQSEEIYPTPTAQSYGSNQGGSTAPPSVKNDGRGNAGESIGQIQQFGVGCCPEDLSNPMHPRLGGETSTGPQENNQSVGESDGRTMSAAIDCSWWTIEPEMGRVAHGVANRVDRIKALGNGVVPLQVKKAFEILMGIRE